MLASEKPATLPPTITILKGDFSDIFMVVHFERGMMAKSRFMVIVKSPSFDRVGRHKHGHIISICVYDGLLRLGGVDHSALSVWGPKCLH
jgi:hypothetical protein